METNQETNKELESLIDSDNVHEKNQNDFQKLLDIFEDGDAAHLRTGGEPEGRYFYREDDGSFLVAYECEGKWRRFRFDEFDSELQIWTWCADTIEQKPLEDTKLHHSVHGKYDI